MDLGSSLQYKDFDMSHSFWQLMVAGKKRLLVTMESVIFWLAWFDHDFHPSYKLPMQRFDLL